MMNRFDDSVSVNKDGKKGRLSTINIVSWIITIIALVGTYRIYSSAEYGFTYEGALLDYIICCLGSIIRAICLIANKSSRLKGILNIAEIIICFVVLVFFFMFVFPSNKSAIMYNEKNYVPVTFVDGPGYYELENPFIFKRTFMSIEERNEITMYRSNMINIMNKIGE